MIQIVCIDISPIDETEYRRLYGAASPRRQARADRMRLFADRVRCVAGDALIRYALCVRGIPGCYRMDTGTHGKPFLPDAPDLCFSLSHSGRWAAIAWGNRPVGLDLETVAPRPTAEALARRRFAPAEQAYLAAAPEGERLLRFYRLWTAKEAYVKYLGTGLTRSLASFSVVPPDAAGVPLHWRMLPGCCLCLCAPDDDVRLSVLPAAQLTTLHDKFPGFRIGE
ncbi:MAG: 4'-phosphopantetheinyl transferase superfamily protein [Clostridia bacterium]|nr:4'-phosphopantetheinyl transferase superfamily protein [Clostridia bacterium]